MTVETVIEQLQTHQTKSELTSWKRKRKKMEALVEKVNEIESSIEELNNKRIILLDEVVDLRALMIKECVHPHDMIVEVEDGDGRITLCKFCDKKIAAATIK